jgi:23S rRNA (adenine2503-C2)-methyltransferase
MGVQMINKIPTGYLFTIEGSRGQLETLSIGDYGKSRNIKADFLGFTREIEGVANGDCMPLSEKWVITLSTQYGCPQKCTFCDVPKIPFKGNASFEDLKKQLYKAIDLFPDVHYTDRLNIHYARMGEPILNPAVFEFTEWLNSNKMQFQRETGLSVEVIHPVLTTSLPRRFKGLEDRLHHWMWIKNNDMRGQAGLQISINSTDEGQRQKMFGGEAITLQDFSAMADDFKDPLGRKYCLNFAYASDFEVDASKLIRLFSPEKFMCKITPIHNNTACRANNIETLEGYTSYTPYKQVEKDLKEAGFDVLVFIPSIDEEDGLVTCGNLVLSKDCA